MLPISSQSNTEKERCCDTLSWFVIVCRETGGGGVRKCLFNLQTESQQTRSELLFLIRWRLLLITPSQVAPRHPQRRGRHAMAIRKKSVKHWLMKLTVNLLSLVFHCMRPRAVVLPSSPHYNNNTGTSASAVWSHLLLLLTLTTWGQYCHIERGAVEFVWSRLRWSSCLFKVL